MVGGARVLLPQQECTSNHASRVVTSFIQLLTIHLPFTLLWRHATNTGRVALCKRRRKDLAAPGGGARIGVYAAVCMGWV
jgi:hypothetical protein